VISYRKASLSQASLYSKCLCFIVNPCVIDNPCFNRKTHFLRNYMFLSQFIYYRYFAISLSHEYKGLHPCSPPTRYCDHAAAVRSTPLIKGPYFIAHRMNKGLSPFPPDSRSKDFPLSPPIADRRCDIGDRSIACMYIYKSPPLCYKAFPQSHGPFPMRYRRVNLSCWICPH